MMRRRQFMMFSTVAVTAGCTPFAASQQGTPKPVRKRSYDLRGITFAARQGLTVSEEEAFFPDADIVWRGDPAGPRIAQIGAMFAEATARNRAVLTGAQPVDIAVALIRFHGVTERTRRTVGGVYNIVFDMTVLDANTGTTIEKPRRIVANLNAPGGVSSLVLGGNGQTQRERVTDFLTGVLRQELV